MTSRATTIQRPRALTKQRLSAMFWGLARGSGTETESRDPEAVVRHLLAVIHALEGARRTSDISADSLSFLLQLEHDPYYASPEQTRGGEKDCQSLVYSIGVLLFERLTGHHPFVESLSPIHCAVVRDRSQRIGANNLASVPLTLRSIVNTALLPFPPDRWDGVAELRRQLEGFLGRAETVLAPLPHERGASHPVPLRAPTQHHQRELPTLERVGSDTSRRQHSTIDGTPRRRFADGTGPHHRRARRATPPPPPGSAERARSESYPEIIVERRADSPDLSDSISHISQVDLSAILDKPRRGSNVLVIAGLVVVLISVVATVTAMFLAESRAATLRASLVPVLHPVAAPPPAAKLDVIAKPVAAADDKHADETATDDDAKPVPKVFDIHYAGERALAAARTCFDPSRLHHTLEVGATLLFSHTSGHSTQVYLASHMKADTTERGCLKHKLIGITAGAPPHRGTLVTYTLFLTKDGGRAHGQVRK